MDRLHIEGGRPLEGRVEVAGAKNAALPILAGCLLTEEPVELVNVPRLQDIHSMLELLGVLGMGHRWTGPHALRLEATGERGCTAPYDLVRKMRAGILVLGPLLASRGRARVSRPGGCAIGARPVDLHVMAVCRLGAEARMREGYIEAEAGRLRGATVRFDPITVTGTENALMAAVLAEGTTVLENAAREPEVVDLADFLRSMGAEIEGAGTSRIEVEGVDALGGCRHEIVPDRIEAGTLLLAGAITGGSVAVQGCRPVHLEALLATLEANGLRVERGEHSVHVAANGALRPRDIQTAAYPGFPTDMQAQYLACMTRAEGSCVVTETIFENRFQHVAELARLGARIDLDGRRATVHGPVRLQGGPVMATDLRASASLVLAGLAAEGETVLRRVYHLDRGYESLETKVAALGGRIERVAPDRR